ncbi:MAG: ATP-binding cassette domain-containing protein [Clostridia bacterium]|nr:ATP-binding cassette domain-containing protein [Clostridia bacterium]
MEIVKAESLSFRYPCAAEDTLRDISFSVARGEFVVVCGMTGCGKSTLLRQLKPSLAPQGERSGEIFFEGAALYDMSFEAQSRKIGFVAQEAEGQVVTDKVWHEMAFVLESFGLPSEQIRARVAETACFFGIQSWFYKDVSTLSGGQKQILNLASVMVAEPSLLLLDEPTSSLDPVAAKTFFETLARINRETGTTIVLSEHRMEDVFPLADRVIVMDAGKIIADGTLSEISLKLKELNHPLISALPTPMRIFTALGGDGESPVTVREGCEWLTDFARKHTHSEKLFDRGESFASDETAAELDNVWFAYAKDALPVLTGVSLKVRKGEFYAILGGNGAGKTTALSLISGANEPFRGKVKLFGKKKRPGYDPRVALLPQEPQSLFLKSTLELDLYEKLGSDKKSSVERVMKLCEIEHLRNSHPYDLSGGEKQRAALAKVILSEPDILLLDEPTKGLDAAFKYAFAQILSTLRINGMTIIMVSHDVEFCARYADRCAMFFEGTVVSEGEPREFFAQKSFYTTVANRMARPVLPDAILAEDIILAYGGEIAKPPEYEPPKAPLEKAETKEPKVRERSSWKKERVVWLILCVLIPFTIFFGIRFMEDRKYFFISLLIVLESIAAFCTVFEKRSPHAREIVTLSTLAALAVASRLVFFALPQFKPLAAVVIIAGVSLGAEAGFLVGAVAAFVSNMFFGQGPWTPWQMFAFGMVGAVAGALFNSPILQNLKKKKTPLCVFGALAVMLIYGGIMNAASVLMWQQNPTVQMFSAEYVSGVPFDAVHATGVVFFLYFAAEPILEKIERIKNKYGVMKRN